jgi:hypothetical protein
MKDNNDGYRNKYRSPLALLFQYLFIFGHSTLVYGTHTTIIVCCEQQIFFAIFSSSTSNPFYLSDETFAAG